MMATFTVPKGVIDVDMDYGLRRRKSWSNIALSSYNGHPFKKVGQGGAYMFIRKRIL